MELSQQRRNEYRREAEEQLRELVQRGKKYEETIARLRNEKQPFRTLQLIEKNILLSKENTNAIEKTKKYIIEIDQGDHDDAFLKEIQDNMEREAQLRKKKIEGKKKSINLPAQQIPFPKVRFATENEMKYAYDRYRDSFSKIPETLRQELRTLPCNRGFIWRGDYLYGPQRGIEPLDVSILRERVQCGSQKFEILEHTFTPTQHIVSRVVRKYYGKNKYKEERVRVSCVQKFRIY